MGAVVLMLMLLLHGGTTSAQQQQQFDATPCGQSKGCLFAPAQCRPDVAGECKLFFSYVVTGGDLTMELQVAPMSSKSSAYVAVGFSKDTLMGDDAVTACLTRDGSTATAQLAYNRPNAKSNQLLTSDPATLSLLSSSINNGALYCKLRQSLEPANSQNGHVFPLDASYNVLLATGTVGSNGDLGYHSQNKYVLPVTHLNAYVSNGGGQGAGGGGGGSDELQTPQQNYGAVSTPTHQQQSQQPQQSTPPNYQSSVTGNGFTPQQTPFYSTGDNNNSNNNNNGGGGGSSQTTQRDQTTPQQQQQMPGIPQSTTDKLKIAHGILMTLAFSVFIASGIIYARYFRSLVDRKIFGMLLWFHVHRILNITGVAASIAGFVMIFSAMDWQWYGPSANRSREENQQWGSVHAMVGLLACVIAWAQPLNAVFRCDHTSRVRFVFNAIHRFFGMGAFLLAAAATMIACVHFDTMFSKRKAAMGLYIAYLAALGLCLILLEIISIYTWIAGRRARRYVTATVVGVEMTSRNGEGGHSNGGTSHPPPHYDWEEREKARKFFLVRLFIFAFFLVAAIGTSVAICVLIGKKPNTG